MRPMKKSSKPIPAPKSFDRALNAHILRLGTLASVDDSRFTLQGILVTESEAIVTDGHLLARVDLPKVELDKVPSIRGMKTARTWKPFILPADACAEALKSLPRKPSLPILSNAFVADT